MTYIDYGPDVPVEQYEAALRQSFADTASRKPAPSPLAMPKKKRGKK